MAQVEIEIVGKDSFSGALGNFGSIITGIESAINLAGRAFSFFKDQALAGLDAVASYERMSASLETLVAKQELSSGAATTMTQALRLAGPAAEELLNWTQQLAINSPFTAEGVNEAFRMAMAYGFTTDEAKRLTEAMIDFAAGSGATEYAMTAIARALGQISATGKVTGGDMLQLVNAGLPVVEILAEGFGVTTAELMKMREKGLLPATEAIEYITQYLETNFAGAAERQANTWAGLQGTFEDIKTMGLREFFGGMFEALQPLAVKLSEFLQTEGMDKLREWGTLLGMVTEAFVSLATGAKLYDLGFQMQQWSKYGGPAAETLYAIGTAIKVFQQAMDDGATSREAFILAIQKFTDLTGIELDFWSVVGAIDANLADAINAGVASGAFRESGDAFGDMIISLLGVSLDGRESEAAPAIGAAISQWFEGAVGSVYFEHSAGEIFMAFSKVLYQEAESMGQELGDKMRQWFKDIARAAWQGLIEGFTSINEAIDQWAWDHIVIPIRRIFGISSPSTVFMEIGRNIVQGLWDGMAGMWDTFTGWVSDKFTNLLSNLSWENILAVITGQMTVAELFGGSGGGTYQPYSPGGYAPGGYTIPTGSGGGTVLTGGAGVINNFYGPVYVGTMAELYDCPSPHPLMTASSQSLLTSTVTP